MDEKPTLRPAYATEISLLEKDVLDMVSRAEVMVAMAVDSLVKQSTQMAREAIMQDDAIDQKDMEIEQRCLKLLALQQPMGSDLREIGTVLKIITDIERIGDLAVDIAKLTMKIEAELGQTNIIDIKPMSNTALQMLREAIQMFVRRDTSNMDDVVKLEDIVDAEYRNLRGQLHDFMRTDTQQVVTASWMLLGIHHVERIADHALNIAERVNYMVTGQMSQLRSDL